MLFCLINCASPLLLLHKYLTRYLYFSQPAGAARFIPDNSHEDFELKKLLLNILHAFLEIPAAILLLSHLPLLPSLLYYVTPIQPVSSGTGRSGHRLTWSSEQWEEIQLQSLCVLSHLAGKLPEQFHACQGNARLLGMLDWCLCEDDHLSYGKPTELTTIRYHLPHYN